MTITLAIKLAYAIIYVMYKIFQLGDYMITDGKIQLASGFIFDYKTMLGDGRITENDLLELKERAQAAAAAIDEMRKSGYAKAHLSKDGTPEPVYFTHLPYIKEGSPNSPESIAKLKDFADYMQREVDAVIFLGVGGSFLGNRVLYDIFAGGGWNNFTHDERDNHPRLFFGGNNIDPWQSLHIVQQMDSLAENRKHKGDKFRLLLVPISKSGTTLETLTAFSYYYQELTKRENIDVDVAVVTDLKEETGSPLYKLAKENGWRTFDVKEGVGGRFSVLNDVGLVTAAAIGLDIEMILEGARAMDKACQKADFSNPALLNACLKYIADSKYSCDTEVFMSYGMCLKSLGEWYVQLLAESLGKRHNRDGETVFYGRTPIAAVGSTDMHAQTQQHQDGKRNKVIQFLQVDEFEKDVVLGNPFPHLPDFAKYDGVSLNKALQIALLANREALDKDNRFSALYRLPTLNEFYIGQIFYFLMLSIAYEGELANVDAFDQPGVEAYKKIIKRELGR